MLIMLSSTPSLLQKPASFPYGTLSACPTFRASFQKRLVPCSCSVHDLQDKREQKGYTLHSEEKLGRRLVLLFLVTADIFPTLPSSGKTKNKNPYDEKRLLEQNKRIQKDNNAPEDFPNFVREGFQVNVVTSENYVKRDSGLIYRDFEVGKGDCPKAGQQVIFHYSGYNESGRRIDSTYLRGSPAKIRMGTNSLVPGFEEGIRDMRPGGKRRVIIPPELGPPLAIQLLQVEHYWNVLNSFLSTKRDLNLFSAVVWHMLSLPLSYRASLISISHELIKEVSPVLQVGPSTFFSSKQFEVFDVELLSIQDCRRRTIAFYSDVVCD